MKKITTYIIFSLVLANIAQANQLCSIDCTYTARQNYKAQTLAAITANNLNLFRENFTKMQYCNAKQQLAQI